MLLSFCNFGDECDFREHDQDPINYEDSCCQWIIRATKEVPYTGDPVSNDFCEIELTDNTIENDSPEKNIDNISSPYLHLAQQEHSFSDENMAASSVSVSEDNLAAMPVSDTHVDIDVHSSPSAGHDIVVHAQRSRGSVEKEQEADSVETVCFSETERNTSCAIDIPDIPNADE